MSPEAALREQRREDMTMKKAPKKLTLSRETLRLLSDGTMKEMPGGCVRGECTYYCETGPIYCPFTETYYTC